MATETVSKRNPDGLARDPSRVGWLDGLRGIAALQVLLLHYVTAFLPSIGLRDPRLMHFAWERAFINTPIFLPFDGYSAVYIFFLLSGVALTYSFQAHPYSIGPGIARRVIRLGVPMLAAITLGAVWHRLWPGAHLAAARLSGSMAWLGSVGPVRTGFAAIVHQAGLEGLLAGYREMSVLTPAARDWFGLVPLVRSFNAPLWTLHIEFVGSLIVLGLVALRQAIGRIPHLIACLLLIAALASSLLSLFIVGHLAAAWLRTSAASRKNLMLGIGLVELGILLDTTDTMGFMTWLHDLLPTPFIGKAVTAAEAQRMAGAAALFLGVACLPQAQNWLSRAGVRWLGKISFSLYLTHFPVLFTAASAAFVAITPHLPYLLAVLVVTVAGSLLSMVIAVGFEAAVDGPAIRLSRLVFRLLVNLRPLPPSAAAAAGFQSIEGEGIRSWPDARPAASRHSN